MKSSELQVYVRKNTEYSRNYCPKARKKLNFQPKTEKTTKLQRLMEPVVHIIRFWGMWGGEANQIARGAEDLRFRSNLKILGIYQIA